MSNQSSIKPMMYFEEFTHKPFAVSYFVMQQLLVLKGALLAQLVECATRQGHGFESRQGRSVVSLSKTLYLHCLVLVQPRKASRND